jgi:heme/copper-type cytochrome/quinol oxidase subunit 2
MDERGTIVFVIFIVIAIIGFTLYYAIKCSRRFAAEADQQREAGEARAAEGTEMV